MRLSRARAIRLDKLLRHLCADRGAALTTSGDVGVSGRLVASSRGIENLIDKAIRYGQVSRVSGSEGGAVMSIDDGGGIPEERLDAVLEPFTRGNARSPGEAAQAAAFPSRG